MRPLGTRRVIIAVLAGIVLAGVVAAALLAAGGFADGSPLPVLSWVVPVLAGAIVAGIAFLLLESEDASSQPDESLQACESCGAELLANWRICPNCGVIVDDESMAKRHKYRARAIL